MRARLWRAVAVYRFAALGYAVLLVAANHRHYSRPALAYALLAVMAAWSVLAGIGYRRTPPPVPLFALDVATSVGVVLATLAVEPPSRIDAGAPTLPAAWAASAVLACAVGGGPWAGLASAAAVSAADLAERGAVTQHTFNGIVLLLLAGGVGGYVVRLGVRAEDAVATAARREAAVAERERLARDIHDSVLQVLALVARRGAAVGGETAELARLAGEQEAALRALIRTAPSEASDGAVDLDLRSLLEPLGTDRVSVATPATPVRLPAHAARETAAAAKAALDNVDAHAGPAARAWILVEDTGSQVLVTVRDDGAGFGEDRLEAARRDGRLGVETSILGRMRALGGDAELRSAPGRGTEVELRVPR